MCTQCSSSGMYLGHSKIENFSKEEIGNSSESVLGEGDEQGAFFGSPLILTPFTSGNCEGMPDTLADHK